jgi:hypothetical protein
VTKGEHQVNISPWYSSLPAHSICAYIISHANSSFRPLLKFSIVESKESSVEWRESGVFAREDEPAMSR